jgi:ribosomal protein L25 (general stress protein Ctc)
MRRATEGLMKKLVLGFVSALAFAGSANAGDWRLIYVDDRDAIAVEAGSVRRTGTTAVGWVAIIYAKTESGIDYALSRRQFDCAASTVKTLSILLYTADGESAGSSHNMTETKPVAPDTLEDHTFRAVCYDEAMGSKSPWESVTSLLATYRRNSPPRS